jgi:hypothetical protein
MDESQRKDRQSRHQCFIYEGSPSRQLPALAATMKRKMDEGYRCLYLNSLPMVAGVRSSLAAIGVDVASAVSGARLVLSSESMTAADGSFDVRTMLERLEGALDQALRDGFKGLWATGDMTWEFGSRKNFAKLLEYEYRLEELFAKRPELGGICQYHRDTLPHEVIRKGLLTHRTIFVNETLSRINPHYFSVRPSAHRLPTNAELDNAINGLCQLQAS